MHLRTYFLTQPRLTICNMDLMPNLLATRYMEYVTVYTIRLIQERHCVSCEECDFIVHVHTKRSQIAKEL